MLIFFRVENATPRAPESGHHSHKVPTHLHETYTVREVIRIIILQFKHIIGTSVRIRCDDDVHVRQCHRIVVARPSLYIIRI